jgi:hypothetical protein
MICLTPLRSYLRRPCRSCKIDRLRANHPLPLHTTQPENTVPSSGAIVPRLKQLHHPLLTRNFRLWHRAEDFGTAITSAAIWGYKRRTESDDAMPVHDPFSP